MQLAQGEGPGADFTQGWPGWRECGRLEGTHAFLLSDATDSREVSVLLECHIISEKSTKSLLLQGKIQGVCSPSKCHCSEPSTCYWNVLFWLNGLGSPLGI